MLWSIDSCQKGHLLTSVTSAQVYVVQVITAMWFFKLSTNHLLVSLRASSPIWASEVGLARMHERGAEERL